MPGEEGTPLGYTQGRGARDLDEARLEASQAEDLRYVRETILLLTGGCEICQHATGPYCRKHRRQIRPGDSRCEFFARRLPEDPEEASRAQVRRYVGETLGIRDRRIATRLTGD